MKKLIEKYKAKIADLEKTRDHYDGNGQSGACIAITGEIQAYRAVIRDLETQSATALEEIMHAMPGARLEMWNGEPSCKCDDLEYPIRKTAATFLEAAQKVLEGLVASKGFYNEIETQ